MRHKLDKSSSNGIFSIAPDIAGHGTLSLDRPATSLSLSIWDERAFDIEPLDGKTITGVLDSQKKVSLINCVNANPNFSGSQHGGGSISYTIFPHYVIFGNEHISDTDQKIYSISFRLDDATTLFYDRSAFGFASHARPIVTKIVESRHSARDISIGSNPHVAYNTGDSEIFSCDTAIGRVSAYRTFRSNTDGHKRIIIDNKIYIIVAFRVPITFHIAVSRMRIALRLFELIAGRAQNLVECGINTGTDENSQHFDVYYSLYPYYQRSANDVEINALDILMDAVRDPNKFANVLSTWLDRGYTWRGARERFFQSFEKPRSYDIDRLISVANAFDIMPKTAFPKPAQLPSDLEEAKEKAKELFKKLPQSADKDSVLNALGRVGSLTLKRKIACRCSCLLNTIGDRLPELLLVTDEAVNCRNYYVHGTEARIDYNEESDMRRFLTDTLEFVFAASDLVEAGWDIAAWCERGRHRSHPFGAYMDLYSLHLAKLKSLLRTRKITLS